MGGKENGAVPVTDFPHQLLEQVGCPGIQTHKGFIHDYQPGGMHQGGNNRQLLPHAVGISGYRLFQIRSQFKGIRIPVNAFLSVRGGNTKDIRHKMQELDSGH